MSWKKYGGINQQEQLNNLNVNTTQMVIINNKIYACNNPLGLYTCP
jgi:hypothetical protein